MAANVPPELASGNPCCLAWQEKYIAMKKRRDYCKQAIDILQQAMEKANVEKKLVEADRDTKGIDSAVKASMEKEISDLKSEVLSLQQRLAQNLKKKSEETKLIKDKASSREKEISELKDLLKKETLRADNSEEEREKVCKELNKTKAAMVKYEDIKPEFPELKKEISLIKSILASERQKTESEREKADSEKKKADQYLSDLRMVTSNLETVKKQLELEKQKTLKERKRAEMESGKAREHIKLAEELSKKFEIIRARNEELKKDAELQSASSKVKSAENSAKLEEKTKLLEMNKKTAMEWKSRADDLTQQLREAQLVTEGLKKQLHELSLSQKSTESRSVPPHKVGDLEKAKVRLLKKELNLEKKSAKHFKKVAEFEKSRREIQEEEIGRLKLEFGSMTNRLNLLGEYPSRGVEDTAGLAKAKGCMKLPMLQSQKNRDGEEHSDARRHLVASPGSQDQARKFAAQLIPISGRGVSESVSGTTSQLDSLTGGSRELQISGVISSATSFSDGQSLASQGKEQLSVTTSAEVAKDKLNIQPTESSMLKKVDTRKNGNLCLVAENSLQSRQRDSHEVEHPRKRKRMSEAVESRKHLLSDDKNKKLQIGDKLSTLQSMVVETGYRPLEKEETLVPDMQGGSSGNCITTSKKRKVPCEKKTIMPTSLEFNLSAETGDKAGSTQVAEKTMSVSTAKGHDAATLFLEDVIATDYMKLLELDTPEEEHLYRMARESLLSPDLPQVDFLGSETVIEVNNPARPLDLVANNSVDLCDTINSSEAVPIRVGLAATMPHSLNTQNALVTVILPAESTAVHDHILKHFVVYSSLEDQDSIIKIFHATNSCIQRCPSVTRAQWAVPAILFTLKTEGNLFAEERACVFLSLLLHNFSVVSTIKTGNTLDDDSCSCLDSFSKHIYGVVADIEAKGVLCGFLEELLSLLQEFLSEQRVLSSVNSSETSESDLSFPVTPNGFLSSRVALTDHLVAGSAILAAICTALDRVRFIREASCEILYQQSHEESSMTLTILHIFAYIAGEKMISTSGDHDISIPVLKCIVMFLENRHFGNVEANAKLHPGKNKCPFSDMSSSLESAASMLMKTIQEFSQSITLHQSVTEKTEYRPALEDFQWALARNRTNTLCDILILVELLACYTAWDWTRANIVAPLLKILGMPLPTKFSFAIVIFLGQLISIGVDPGGYENEGISNLREKLTAFLQCKRTLEAGFAVQFATVLSLLRTLQLDFSLVFQGKTAMAPSCVDQRLSAPANLITKWFTLLNDEQRGFANRFLHNLCVVS
ncbi:unnamed protein product [Thlaspi arvense]|uniref:Maternal effect embryo arrest 22 n=1 Tax=Thlaspi arvense TaxID=13288 RepID=A0AAU9SAR4_THLAR|nr:unnamed protein product [Thlaspi arvense]